VPRSKKTKPGKGRSKQFETIFCVAQIGLFIILWVLKAFFQATTAEILVVYFGGTLAVIVVMRAIDREAAEDALSVLGRP
jgi:hypothetical protein